MQLATAAIVLVTAPARLAPTAKDGKMSMAMERLAVLVAAGKMWICLRAAVIAVAASFVASQFPSSVPAAAAEPTSSSPAKPTVPSGPAPMRDGDEQEQPLLPVVVPATIQAFFVTDLYAKNAGYVSQINNDIGDHVKKGQILAIIENPELQAQFEKAQAAVEQAKAALEVARRQLAGMQADLVLQQVTLQRQKELFAGKAATAQMLDEAQAKEGVSSATVETGKAKIRLAEADLQAANAEANRLQALLEYDRIVAPFDGVVTRRLVNPGDLVQSATATRTTPLFTCQQIDVVRVFADAPEASASAIRPGTRAEVKLYDTGETSFVGSVTRVATALDPSTRTMRVEIDLPNPHEKLQPGMYARVTLGMEPDKVGAAKP
jgi:RND family efflux transporter MFP subunit